MRDSAAQEAMNAGWGTGYAWLRNPTPVSRRMGIKGQGQGVLKRIRRERKEAAGLDAAGGEEQVSSSSSKESENEGSEDGSEMMDDGDADIERDASEQALPEQNLLSGPPVPAPAPAPAPGPLALSVDK